MNKDNINQPSKPDFKTLSLKDLGLNIDVSKGPKELSDCHSAFSEYVRILRNNWRQGSVGCLGRSDVSYSNKKPWKQKGTGRARAGSARSPIWRGGGVTFGPQERSRSIKMSKCVRKNVLASLLSSYVSNNRLIVEDFSFDGEVPKTKVAYELLKKNGILGKRINVFLSSKDDLFRLSFSNIRNIRILFFDQPNAFDLANSDFWLLLKKDLKTFKEEVVKWI